MDISKKVEEKIRAWKEVKKNTEEGDEKILMRIYKNNKNIVNKARKRVREEH